MPIFEIAGLLKCGTQIFTIYYTLIYFCPQYNYGDREPWKKTVEQSWTELLKTLYFIICFNNYYKEIIIRTNHNL